MDLSERFLSQQHQSTEVELATREIHGRTQLERLMFAETVLEDREWAALSVKSNPISKLFAGAMIRLKGENELIRQRYFENLSCVYFLRHEDHIRVGVNTGRFGNFLSELDATGFLVRVWSGEIIVGKQDRGLPGNPDFRDVVAFDATPLILPEQRIENNQSFFEKALNSALERAAADGVRIPATEQLDPFLSIWLRSDPIGTSVLVPE